MVNNILRRAEPCCGHPVSAVKQGMRQMPSHEPGSAGDEVGNGVYLFVVRVKQRGEDSILRGKLARIK